MQIRILFWVLSLLALPVFVYATPFGSASQNGVDLYNQEEYSQALKEFETRKRRRNRLQQKTGIPRKKKTHRLLKHSRRSPIRNRPRTSLGRGMQNSTSRSPRP